MDANDPTIRAILILRNGLTQIVEELNTVLEEMGPPGPWMPNIDTAELDAAPWLTYNTKTPAEPGHAAWLKNPVHFQQFEPPKVIYELVKGLQHSPDHTLQLGDMEYFFSGEDKFIGRRPKKVQK